MKSASEDLGIAFFDTFDNALKSATDVMTDAIGGLAEMFKLMDESPLETAIRHIGELGGNTLDLRTELAELNLEQAKMGSENLPTINEAIEKQKSNTAELIEQERLLKEAQEQLTEKQNEGMQTSIALEGGRVRQNAEAQKAIANAIEEKGKIIERIETLKQDNEAQAEAIKKRQELEQAELDLKGVRAEADEANKVRVEETDPKDLSGKEKLVEVATAEIQILQLKLALLEEGESARETEKEALLFQIENADRLNISEAKRLQLRIQLLKLGQQEAKQNKKKAEDDKKAKEDEIKLFIANANSAEEALEKKVRAEASNALASLVRSVMENYPFPMNLALAGGVAIAGTKAINNLSELNAGKNGGGMNIVFNAPVTNEDFVKDFIVPTIKESQERNLS